MAPSDTQFNVMTRKLEEKVGELQEGITGSKARPPGEKSCSTCSKSKHTPGMCPGLNMKGYACHKKGTLSHQGSQLKVTED